jgi:hypothetical protein
LTKKGFVRNDYLDGVSVYTNTITASVTSAGPMYIGWDIPASAVTNFQGPINEVRIWNVARTPAQISASMNTELAGTETGLVAYYTLNEGTANSTNTGVTTAFDLAGCNNGTLTNFGLSGTTSNWTTGNAMTTVADPVKAEINLQGNSTNIVDGDTSPTTADHTDFGSTSVGGNIARIFTIQNTGGSVLNISSLTSSNAKFVVSGAPATVAASGSATFTVTYTPTAVMADNATITINNNDCNEVVYDFAVTGAGTAPEINVQGNSVSITDGDTSPTTADHTDFGSVSVGGNIARTFTIQNTGGAVLNITSVTSNNAKFVVSGAPTSVAASSSATFTVTYTPTAVMIDNATITINNNDADEAAYDFAVMEADVRNALHFDGVDDHVVIPRSIQDDFTIEFWFKTSQAGSNGFWWQGRGIVDGEVGGVTNDFGVSMGAGRILFGIGNPDVTINSISGSLNDAQWHHVAATRVKSTGVIALYIDGVLNQTTTSSNTSSLTAPTNMRIGGILAGGNFFNSTMDEVRLWNVARTCSQIQSTMNRELVGNESGLVAYYNFNQGVAAGNNTAVTTLIDNQTNVAANNGTLTGFAGLGGGSASNWVDGSGNDVSGTTPQTPADINVTVGASGSTKDVGGYATGTPVDFTYTIQNTGQTNLSLTNSPIVEVTSGVGFAVQTQPSASTIAGGGSLTFVIRFTPAVTGTTYTTAFRILNSDCDEGTYTFTLTGKATNATAGTVRGNMMSFDGVDDEINCGTGINLANVSFTLECWAKRAATGAEQHLFGAGTTAFAQGLHCRLNADGTVRFAFWGPDYDAPAGTYSTDGLWHHYAFTYDATSNVRSVYVDGRLIGSDIASADFQGTGTFNIGGHVPGYFPRSVWNGNIDEVRVWRNVARTQAQIRENMHLTMRGAESGLVGYWQFNETSGSAIDAIAGNNGTLQNGASRITSTVSVAKGFATRLTVPAGASTQTFGNAIINFTAMTAPAANDEFVTYQLQDTPLNNVSANNTASNYWLVRQFGTQTFSYNQMNFTLPASNIISTTDVTTPSNLKLFKRNHNSGGTWGTAIGTGTSANNTTKVINYNISPAQTSFSEFIPASVTSPLPITLIGFEGRRVEGLRGKSTEEVRLEWSTASEINNKGFEVEMSEDGLAYQKIAFVEGRGSSNTPNNYQLTTINQKDGYYRLRQMDFDGKFSYSPVVFVEGVETLKIYPNPSNGTFTISVGKEQLESPARLLNAQGKEVWSGTQTEVHANNLPAGIYFLHLTQGGKMHIKKIVVKK